MCVCTSIYIFVFVLQPTYVLAFSLGHELVVIEVVVVNGRGKQGLAAWFHRTADHQSSRVLLMMPCLVKNHSFYMRYMPPSTVSYV